MLDSIVSNAVFDGTDAVMLSGETASGKYPVESVKTMALITSTTEGSDEYLGRMKLLDSEKKLGAEIGQMVAHSAYKLSRNLGAAAILVPTLHGNTARIIGSFRPEQIVIAVTPEKKVCRQLMVQWGISPVLCKVADDSETMIQNAVKNALDSGAVKLGDKVVMCAGIPLSSPLMINTIRVMLVGNVIARGTVFGHADSKIKKASGRVIHEDDAVNIREKLKHHSHLILVCDHVSEDLIPALRIADGVVAQSGSDIPSEELGLLNPSLVWVLHARNALKVLENDLSVTLEGVQGIVYEGIV